MSIIDLIDQAVDAWERGPDAMRWTGGPPPTPESPRPAWFESGDFVPGGLIPGRIPYALDPGECVVGFGQWRGLRCIRRDPVHAHVAVHARLDIRDILARMEPTFRRAARLSAMHAAYRRRTQRRGRR